MQLTVHVTRECNIGCAHCFQDRSSEQARVSFVKELAQKLVERKLISRIGFTGGEAFVRFELLKQLIEISNVLGLPSGVVTNGFWAKSEQISAERLKPLVQLGLATLTLSTDRFHSQFIDTSRILNALVAAETLNVNTSIYMCYACDEDIEWNRQFKVLLSRDFPNCRVYERAISNLGAAQNIYEPQFARPISDIDGRCPRGTFLSVEADGSVFPCCMATTHKRLVLGNLYIDGVDELLRKIDANSRVKFFTSCNMKTLGKEIRSLSDIAKKDIVGTCSLCYHLNDIIEEGVEFKIERDELDELFLG